MASGRRDSFGAFGTGCGRRSGRKRCVLTRPSFFVSRSAGYGGRALRARAVLGTEDFLFCGDIAVEMDPERLVEAHVGRRRGDARRPPERSPSRIGLLATEETAACARSCRGALAAGISNLVFGSVYCLSPRVFDFVRPNEKQDLNNDVFPRMIAAGERVFAYNTPGSARRGTAGVWRWSSAMLRAGSWNRCTIRANARRCFRSRRC